MPLSQPLCKLSAIAVAVASSLSYSQLTIAQDEAPALEEVLVTASRREESLQDTSLIISALSGENLLERGITNMVDLAFDVHSLQVGAAGPALQLYIRGVGTDAATGFSTPGIAVSKDGVYIPRVTAMAANFFDLKRVEVLQGPQGTLYGRNATGGAVNLITNGAELGETTGYVMGDVGNFNKGQFEGAVNIPLNDTMAVRIAGFAVDRSGFMDDDSSDDNRWSARVSTLWTPNEKVSWRVHGGQGQGFTWVGSDDAWDSLLSEGGNAVLFQGVQENGLIAPDIAFPWIQNAPVIAPAPTPPFPPGTNLISLVDPLDTTELNQDLQFWDISSTLEWDLDFAKLTVVGAYQDVEQSYLSRPAVRLQVGQRFGQDDPETSETVSLEARLSGDTEKLTWVAGINIFEEEQFVANAINQGISQNLQLFADIETEAIGLFGQVTYSINDDLRLVGGLRYSDETQDKNDFNRFSVDESIACPPPLTTDVVGGLRVCQISGPESQSISSDSWDWKAGIEYDLTEDSLIFFTASTGFKAGGLPAVSSDGFGPEELTAFSLGTKNILMNGRLQLNGDIFYWEYDDKQENLVGPDDQGIIGLDTINAGESTIQGIAMDIRFAATDRDFFTLNFEYLDATYDEFSYFQGAALTPPTTCPVTPTGAQVPGPAGPTPELFIDCSGFDMTKAPELVARAGYTHTFNLGSTGELDFHVNVNFTDERWLSANFLEGQLVDSFTFWNAHLAYRRPDSKFTALAYIRNITEDEAFQVSLNHTQVPQLIGLAPGAPQTYGLQLQYSF